MKKKRKKKIVEDGAPANNIGSGNIAIPEPSLFTKKDAILLRREQEKGLKKFSSFVK